MKFEKLAVNSRAMRLNRGLERWVNWAVRGYDRTKDKIGLSGRKAPYDDDHFEFIGGAGDSLRKKHYDKSLRLLWKAEDRATFLDFKDCTKQERALMDQALRSMTDHEKAERKRISLPEYKEFLNNEYTQPEKVAIVNLLAAIGHGEAYAWLVSAELINMVKSTGARTALTMQVLEEAKHFVVLRELLFAFDVPIRRQSVWEYLLLEGAYKAKGLDKFFGMNVCVEGIALSLFGMMSHLPGLEILRLFHLDEARHTALPGNYFKEFPMTELQKRSRLARWRRLKLILPTLMLVPLLEEDMAELGVDTFEFGGSVLRKVSYLADRNEFMLPMPSEALLWLVNVVFNAYCMATRPGHRHRPFMSSNTTLGRSELAVEQQIFST